MIVSMFESYLSTTPKDVHILDWLSDATFKDQVKEIRKECDKSKRDSLKAKLPAITPSGTFKTRNESQLIAHSRLIQFDVDKLTPETIEGFKSAIIKFPYTFYCGLSVSGRGLWGLFKISQPNNHKKHFKALQRYFEYYNIIVDAAPSNVASLRGCSFDDDYYLNEDSEVFKYIYEDPEPERNPNLSKASNHNSNSIADDFNINGNIEPLLLSHGWTFAGTKGTNNRYTRPGKTSGISGNYCSARKLFFVWSTDPQTGLILDSSRAFNNWSVFTQLECNGNNKEAAKKLSQLGYGK